MLADSIVSHTVISGISMDSIPPQKPIDTAKVEADFAKTRARLIKEMAARGQGGGSVSGAPTPKMEAGADSPSSRPTNENDLIKEQERLKEEHTARMSFFCDPSNKTLTPEIRRLKNMLEVLLFRGRELVVALNLQYRPKEFAAIEGVAAVRARANELRNIQVRSEYQLWYTEALAMIKLVLPSRLDDFSGLYEYPAKRSKLTKANFRIADAMRGHSATEKIKTIAGEYENVVADWSNCCDLVLTQCDILEAAAAALTTPLHKIQQGAQRNLLNSELLAACELRENGFNRAAGAMAGVVLKRHLASVIAAHSVVLHKKDPTIYDYGQSLKEEGILDIPTWSFIQRLGDLYNRCFTVKDTEPKNEAFGKKGKITKEEACIYVNHIYKKGLFSAG